MISRIRALFAVAALALLAVAFPRASAAPDGWKSEPDPNDKPVRYVLDRVDLKTLEGEPYPRLVNGAGRIVWTNPGAESVQVLYLHLYPNAFRDTRSSYMREFLRDGGDVPEDMRWGGCEITRLELLDGEKLVPEFVQPDDGNADDRTVIRVPLPRPVEPEQQIVLRIDFNTTLSRAFGRSGGWKDFVFAAQWYPKLGRYVGLDSKTSKEGGGPHVREGWFCPQFHHGPEFSADYADYEVTLRVPASWKSGATGILQDGAKVTGETREERWVANGVVDFAWTAGRRYEEQTRTLKFDLAAADSSDPIIAELRRIQRTHDLPESDVALPPVEVRFLYQPEHAHHVERTFKAARAALGIFGAWFGPYPYPRLTIVDPAFGADDVGGMEYPMLVTTGVPLASPIESQWLENVTVHEILHQWFMNTVATNETLHGFLDEGMTTYFTARAMRLAYLDARGLPVPGRPVTQVLGRHWPTQLAYTFPGISQGWPAAWGMPEWAQPPELDAFRLWRDVPALAATQASQWTDDEVLPARRSYLRGAGWDPMDQAGWKHVTVRSYGTNAYPRAVLFYETLWRTARRQHGPEEGDLRMERTFREYARKHRFSHPVADDFFASVREHAGFDSRPLFDALGNTPATLDVAIEDVKDSSDPELPAKDAPPAAPPATPPAKRTTVLVRRRSEVVVPLQLRVKLRAADGTTKDEERTLDPARRWERLEFAGEVVEARLDPDRVYMQDARLSDNVWLESSSARPGVKWGGQILLWLENALATYGQLL